MYIVHSSTTTDLKIAVTKMMLFIAFSNHHNPLIKSDNNFITEKLAAGEVSELEREYLRKLNRSAKDNCVAQIQQETSCQMLILHFRTQNEEIKYHFREAPYGVARLRVFVLGFRQAMSFTNHFLPKML